MKTYTTKQLAECAEREVRKRQQVYPNLIVSGKMTQAFADDQVGMMQEIAERLHKQALAEKPTLF